MESSAAPAAPAAPSVPFARLDAVDVVRGVALLGIFVMNVRDFGLPLAWFDRPGLAGGFGVGNVAAWGVGTLLFQDKMIALLSLLFGAGLVLQSRAAQVAGRASVAPWLRRCAWLLLIGVAHALLAWFGDILNTYALCGLLLWPLARLPVRWLVAIGTLLYLVPLWFMHGPLVVAALRESFGVGAGDDSSAALLRSARALLAGTSPALHATPPPDVSEALRIWAHGSWLDAAKENLRLFVPWHLEGGWRISFWRSGGLMAIGMALAKAGVLEARAGANALRRLMAWGYGIGVPLTIGVTATLLCADLLRGAAWEPATTGDARGSIGAALLVRRGAMHVGAALVALGHLGLLLTLADRWRGAAPLRALSRVGRLALSCYLAQTVLATLLFYGYGAGRFGQWSFAQLWGAIGAVWALELAACTWWARRFAIGPCEWAWRSLAAWRRLPWRSTSARERLTE